MVPAIAPRLSALAIVAGGFVVACAAANPAPPSSSKAPVATVAKASSVPAASTAPVPTLLLPGIGMSTSKPPPEVEPSGPTPACASDDDCWSKTCCPARAPEECVHASRARKCAIVDLKCQPTPMHYSCVCDAGECKGRLAPP